MSPTRPGGTARLAPFALLGMAMLWGSTFFSIKELLTRLPAVDLLAVRFVIASAVLVLVAPRTLRMSRATLARGVVLGLLFGAAQITQTIGLGRTAASVSGFITGLYVVFTPVLGAVFFRARLAWTTWLAVAIATGGLAILSVDPSSPTVLGSGEILTLACALLYAGHIVMLGRWSTSATSMSLTLVQSLVMMAMCVIAAAPGGIVLPSGPRDWALMGYLAVICGSVPLFLQIWAQAHVEPTRAAVIMSTEPVWAAFFAILLGGEALTGRLTIGGLGILVAMYLVIRAPLLRSQVRQSTADAPAGPFR